MWYVFDEISCFRFCMHIKWMWLKTMLAAQYVGVEPIKFAASNYFVRIYCTRNLESIQFLYVIPLINAVSHFSFWLCIFYNYSLKYVQSQSHKNYSIVYCQGNWFILIIRIFKIKNERRALHEVYILRYYCIAAK